MTRLKDSTQDKSSESEDKELIRRSLPMFETSVIEKLEAYVYALIDPRTNRPFYIGKGRGNRVFSHVACALDKPTANDKYETITDIIDSGNKVCHLILRHGMSNETALEVESALIDFCLYVIHLQINNRNLGQRSIPFGVMTTDEIVRKYKAEPLTSIEDGFVLININKTYKRAKGLKDYYEATKQSWVISKNRRERLKYALSEYKGFIVGVFKILEWYPVQTKDSNGKKKTRWGFNGVVAESEISDRYLNKSVPKIAGSSNPIRYHIQDDPEMTIGKRMDSDPKQCQKCNSSRIIPIVYGLPTEEAFKESK
jgi:uncharacterized protein